MSTSLRVSDATRAHAAALAAREGTSIGELVEKALDAYETAEFWRATREALTRPADDVALDAAWEHTLRDDLEHG